MSTRRPSRRAVAVLLPPLAALLVTGGCAGPPPKPLSAAAVEEALEPVDLSAIRSDVRVRASVEARPVLAPVPFDERDGLSADEAAIAAVVGNPLLRAARDRRGIAAAQLLQAGILPNPTLDASVGVPVGPAEEGSVTGFDVGLGWDFGALLGRGARIEAAQAHARSVDLDVAWSEWQVAEGAKLRVDRLALAERRLAEVRRALADAQRVVEQTGRAVELGVRTEPELDAARAALASARSLELEARSRRDRGRLELVRVLGLPPGREVPIEAPTDDARPRALRSRPLPPLAELTAQVAERRLDLVALRLGYSSQDARLRAAVRERFPRIGLGLEGGRDPEGIETVGGGLRIELPVFDRGQGRVAVERATRRQLFDEYAARLFEARHDVARAVEEIDEVRERLVVADGNVAVLARREEVARRAADRGVTDGFAAERARAALVAGRLERLDLDDRLAELAVALEIASGRVLFTEAVGGDPDAGTETLR